MDINRKILDHLFPIRKVWGIHIWERDKDQFSIYATLVENDNGVLFVKENLIFDDITVLFSDQFVSCPVCLSYDSRSVLIKEVVADANEQKVLNQLHLNNGDDFKIQLVNALDRSFAFIVRRTFFNELLSRMGDKLQIIEFLLGPVSFNACLPYLFSDKEAKAYDFLNYSVDVENHLISSYSRIAMTSLGEKSLLIGNDNVLSEFVLPYCNALNFFVNKTKVSWLTTSISATDYYDVLYKKLYKILLPACLGLPLLLLLGNFFYLQYYTNYQGRLSQEYAHFQSSHKELQELNNQYEKHLALTGHYSSNLYGFFSIYADRIAALVNGRVNIVSMVFHPIIEGRNSNTGNMAFLEEVVEIEGTCRNPHILNSWFKDLGELVFVESVFDQVYDYDDNLEIGTFKVCIKITQNELEQLQ